MFFFFFLLRTVSLVEHRVFRDARFALRRIHRAAPLNLERSAMCLAAVGQRVVWPDLKSGHLPTMKMWYVAARVRDHPCG